jgi:hypothetical protein
MSFLFNLLGGIGGQIYIYAALILSSFGAGFYVEHLRFVQFQDEVKIVAEKQIAENKAVKKEQEIINDNVKKTYQANIDNIHTFYGSLHNTSSGAMSYNANSTITINGKAVDVLLVAEQCAQTTQQVIALQDWINQMAGLDAK